jgi:hypothetical protein
MDNAKRLADMWLLITSLNTARYAVAELDPEQFASHTKQQLKNLKNFIENFLRVAVNKMKNDDKGRLTDATFDSVGVMVETMSLLAHVPIAKHEEFLAKVNLLVEEVIVHE